MGNGISSIGMGTPVPAVPSTGVTAGANAPSVPVREVAPAAPEPPVGRGGNASPAPGQLLPGVASAVPDAARLAAAVDGINRFLRDSQRQMVFQVDLKGGHETLTIVNPATGEVIRQIPAAQVLQAAANLQQAGIVMPGLFLDDRA